MWTWTAAAPYLHSVPLTDERFEPVLADGLVVVERHLHEVVGDTRGFERRLVFELERLRVDALLETHVHRTRRRQRQRVRGTHALRPNFRFVHLVGSLHSFSE